MFYVKIYNRKTKEYYPLITYVISNTTFEEPMVKFKTITEALLFMQTVTLLECELFSICLV